MFKHKNKIIAAVIVIAALIAAFFMGNNADLFHKDGGRNVLVKTDTADLPQTEADEESSIEPAEENTPLNTHTPHPESGSSNEEVYTPMPQAYSERDLEYSENAGMQLDESTHTDKYNTQPVPEGRPVPSEPENTEITDKKYTCTLSVSCKTILDNMQRLTPEKRELVPADGIIFPETEVSFYDGESVFNVLQREMKRAKIHMEFKNTPIYNSAYIEGINNLYEFDCGELSGWQYSVNGWFPNYGCSRYRLKDGDRVEWVYTCDLGRDVGGGYAASGE